MKVSYIFSTDIMHLQKVPTKITKKHAKKIACMIETMRRLGFHTVTLSNKTDFTLLRLDRHDDEIVISITAGKAWTPDSDTLEMIEQAVQKEKVF